MNDPLLILNHYSICLAKEDPRMTSSILSSHNLFNANVPLLLSLKNEKTLPFSYFHGK